MKIKSIINDFAESLRSAKNKLAQWLLLQKIIGEVVFSREKPRNKKRKMPGKGSASTKETETHQVTPSCLPEACGEEPAITIAISKPIPKPISKSDPETISPVDSEPIPSSRIQTAFLSFLIDEIEDDNLKALLKDRIQEIEEAEDNLEKQALAVLTLKDEINSFKDAYSGLNQNILYLLQKRVDVELISNGCEILDSDDWNPEIQRAIKIDYCLPENATSVISKKISTGLKVNNRLIKKQEVAIQKSKID